MYLLLLQIFLAVIVRGYANFDISSNPISLNHDDIQL